MALIGCKGIRVMRIAAFVYILAVLGFWLFDSGGYINWPVLTITAAVLVQMLWINRLADILIGCLLIMLSAYMLLAVTSDLRRHYSGEAQVRNPAEYFGFGYGIFTLSLIASIIITFLPIYKERLKSKRDILASQIKTSHAA